MPRCGEGLIDPAKADALGCGGEGLASTPEGYRAAPQTAAIIAARQTASCSQ
eukprot:SAG31_NODE_2097_length_6453_cov_16.072867_5_plen_52_part_00